MAKFYSTALLLVLAYIGQAQCPVIRGAMANSCAVGSGEGINEYVFFTSTESGTAADYILYYGSNAIPKGNTPTGILNGADATTKKSTGTITTSGGCSIVEVTSPGTGIPANRSVLFIPANFDQTYDVTGICVNGTVYVVYIGINDITSIWGANGTIANSPSGNRYIQITKGAAECTSGIRTYLNGWPTSTDGNAISWNEAGNATYFNSGCSVIITPVKLLSFVVTGKGINASIIWKTTSEINTFAFEIERSTDGHSFKRIGSIAAAGESSKQVTYSYNDVNIPTGTNYYRLKMVDRDGSFAYSYIIKINGNRHTFQITNLFPKPAATYINVSWNSATAGATELIIYDLSGRSLLTQSLSTNSGMNHTNINISTLAKGNYYIQLKKNAFIETSAFSKQ
jgi:hypothetical protein